MLPAEVFKMRRHLLTPFLTSLNRMAKQFLKVYELFIYEDAQSVKSSFDENLLNIGTA
jgi:hypothetical protein